MCVGDGLFEVASRGIDRLICLVEETCFFLYLSVSTRPLQTHQMHNRSSPGPTHVLLWLPSLHRLNPLPPHLFLADIHLRIVEQIRLMLVCPIRRQDPRVQGLFEVLLNMGFSAKSAEPC
jgi:hypothetical protein